MIETSGHERPIFKWTLMVQSQGGRRPFVVWSASTNGYRFGRGGNHE